MTKILTIEPLTSKAFKPYGDVIEIPSEGRVTEANQGTANKFHHVAKITNLRGEKAIPNLCIYRCQARNVHENEFLVKILERHPYSNQIFQPIADRFPIRYLVVVALNDAQNDKPDMSTLKCFMATGGQGVNYREGCWHHPMIALDDTTNFVVLVHEDGTSADCEVVDVENHVIRIPESS
jgi:allantoicase